ncbi:hypothetical protein NC653_017274 [Populus alba x Populus x berolinensis]|uniref:3,4-dihydroxy-2-butanone-4-phosphate synthase n=1 Tax=Populus alba x Populus x berolinensis TaxID=444605 RepID=A0AAD6QPU1_9ROSI|nr:hypothetical protein NC653_017274 [Populus alba x Populus x berolinensis]
MCGLHLVRSGSQWRGRGTTAAAVVFFFFPVYCLFQQHPLLSVLFLFPLSGSAGVGSTDGGGMAVLDGVGRAGVAPAVDAVSKLREQKWWLVRKLSETFRDFSWYKNRSRHSILYFVIVVDDENGDIEGNLIIAASLASPQQVSFLIKNGSGIVSVGMKEEDLERLKLPLMSPETENEDSSAPTLTITVDAKSGTCTGVSASDRAKTVLALSSPETKPEDFRRPGHVFPLKYRNGGVLRRAGHTEAYVDLVMLAGLPPANQS